MDLDVLPDCSSADIERLRPRINQLALDLQATQITQVQDLDGRDQIIAFQAALNMLAISSRSAAKKMHGTRFLKSIERSMLITRKFLRGFGAQPK